MVSLLSRPLLLFLGAAALLTASARGVDPEVVLIPSSTPRPLLLETFRSPQLRRDLQPLTAQSCAAAACHGGVKPGFAVPLASRGSEFPLWIERDPHAQSWRTMCGEQSVAILRRLKILEGTKIVDQVGFDNCLACHNTSLRFANASAPSTSSVHMFQQEGVGCAACHGPAERWINNHTIGGWSNLHNVDEGFVPNHDSFARARMCASCHVGDRDRDMNHDIIAAGHPALRYEYTTFHNRLPKHWRDANESDVDQYEPQLWLAGQVAALDASLTLLEARASKSHTVSTWPEFAEFDCAACHQSLRVRDRGSSLTPRLGAAHYSAWNRAGVEYLIASMGSNQLEAQSVLKSLMQLRTTIESKAIPDAPSVLRDAKAAREQIDRWVRSRSFMQLRGGFRGDHLIRLVSNASHQPQAIESWEAAAQWYLGAVAARHAWPGGLHGIAVADAQKLRHALKYLAQTNVPPAFPPADQPQPEAVKAVRDGIITLGNVIESKPIATNESKLTTESKLRTASP